MSSNERIENMRKVYEMSYGIEIRCPVCGSKEWSSGYGCGVKMYTCDECGCNWRED
jgi:transposase-like protein